MKYILILFFFCIASCSKNTQVHPPVGNILSKKDLEISQNRSRSLNETERLQIQEWIKNQDEEFYPMAMNYWINNKNIPNALKKAEGASVSYQYDIYDFDETKIYPEAVVKKDVKLGKFEDLKAVENALHYLKPGDQATLLVPSGLAFGTYGDNNKISNDVPLIIKIKVF